MVCAVIGEQAEHGFYAVAALQAAGGTAVGISRDLGIVLAVGGEAHDIIPIEISQLLQVVAVEAGVVGKDETDHVLLKPGTQICDGLGPGAEDGLHRCYDEQCVFVHATDVALDREDMIFGVDGLKCVRICNDGADAHHLVCPVGFGVYNSEFAHAASSLLFLWILYRKQERKARE